MAFPGRSHRQWHTMLPLHSGLSVAQGMRFFSTATGPSSAAKKRIVLVKVGDGFFTPFALAPKMNRAGLLKALKADELFAATLKDVQLDRCTITVIKDFAGKVPTAEEEKAGMSLKAARTVESLVGQYAKDKPLFIHVQLPVPAAQQPGIEGTRRCCDHIVIRYTLYLKMILLSPSLFPAFSLSPAYELCL